MPANPNDGTQLGTSEIISDEYIDPVLGCRVNNNLPATAYKAPRSKIAIGPYGQDWGDAMPDTPLYVESRNERLLVELAGMRDRGIAMQPKFSAETTPRVDARGHEFTTRGVR
jgi:hypothetical protein